MEDLLRHLGSYKDGISAAQSILTMLALLIGAAWAYFKFVQGRVFVSRLEPQIEGRIVRGPTYHLLVVRVLIKNVGLSRVNLDRVNSVIQASPYPPSHYGPDFHTAVFTDAKFVRAILHHMWVEPGEQVCEEHLFALPPGALAAVRLILSLHSPSLPWGRPPVWNAVVIVTPEAEPEHQPKPENANDPRPETT